MGARKRFIESVEYLRKMNFFEEYHNLTSEEIFEKLNARMPPGYLESKEVEEEWKKRSIFEADRYVAIHDNKRVWAKDVEIGVFYPGVCTEILKDVAAVSRGVFEPANIKEKFPAENPSKGLWEVETRFKLKDSRQIIRFYFCSDTLLVRPLIIKINKLIRNSGYQYYEILSCDQVALLVVLTQEEARKLEGERDWKLWCDTFYIGCGKVWTDYRPPFDY